MKRRLKQLAYLCLFLAFWGGVAGLFYVTFLKMPPSCFDGVQNQDEEGIDCGGSCKAFCISGTLQPVSELSAPRVFRPTTSTVAVLVELKNPNGTAGIRQLPYQIQVTGDSGTPLELRGATSIYPGEFRRFVLVRPAGSLAGTLSARLTLATTTAAWAPAQQFARPDLSVVSSVTTATPEGVRVEGTVASDDALAVTEVTVVALFYDGFGIPLGASQTVIPRLQAGDSAPFAVSYPPLAGIDPDATQVIVYGYRP